MRVVRIRSGDGDGGDERDFRDIVGSGKGFDN